jgi:hypothetical protein
MSISLNSPLCRLGLDSYLVKSSPAPHAPFIAELAPHYLLLKLTVCFLIHELVTHAVRNVVLWSRNPLFC